jgi:hypothetical protein
MNGPLKIPPKAELESKGYLFYKKGEDKPVCQLCFEDKNKIYYLRKIEDPMFGNVFSSIRGNDWHCLGCTKTYNDKTGLSKLGGN